MAPPPPQSRFLEGSMNDRASAAPPADFLGPGAESTAEYERQFAMDWKPPDLELADAEPAPSPAPTAGGGFGGGGYSDVLGHRTSFSSVRSGASVFTTNAAGRRGSSSNNNNNNKAPRPAASGFFAQVKERFGLTRSNSSMDVVPRLNSDGANELDDGSAGGSGFFVPPVFKHKRSESVGANHLRKKTGEPRQQQQQQHVGGFFSTSNNSNRDGLDDAHNPHNLTRSATNIAAAAAAAGGGRPPPPHVSMPHVGAIPSLPGFDPTKRPSRDEIAANYQSLLASGFFGTHAIQSTRFAPPGQNLHRQDNGHANNDTDDDKNNDNNNTTNMPSFAQRLVEQDESPHEDTSFPPSPDRLPPPPPPNRAAPPPPPPPPASSAVEVEMEDTTEPAQAPTPAGIPASDTVVFNPVTPAAAAAAAAPAPRSSFSSLYRSAHTTTPSASTSMPPPPPSASTNNTNNTTTKGRKLKSAHKPSLAFSSVPYSSTEPGAEPIKSAQRPFRPPPVSIARFSAEAGRPRSFDAAFLEHQQQQNQRGVKRPFTATHNNDSRASFATTDGAGGAGVGRGSYEDRYDYNYDYEHDGIGAGAGIGIGVATTTTPAEEKQESGARKLVKRLRKSASKISIDLGRTISRQSLSLSRPGDGGDSHQQQHQQHLGGSLESTPSRTSTSSSLRESLSWRLGVSSSSPGGGGGGGGSSSLFGGTGGGGSGSSTSTSTSSNNGFGDSYFSLSNTNSNVEPHHYPFAASAAATATTATPTARAVPDPPAREAPPPPTSPPTFALVTASLLSPDPSSAERNRLKKREIRGRRLRRQESGSGYGSGGSSIYHNHKSPTKSSPLNQPPMVSPPSVAPSFVAAENSSSSGGGGMDWQSSPTKRGRSRSRSRPRRSEASLFMLSSTSTSTSSSSSPRRMAQQDGDGYGGEAREPTVRLLPQRQLFGAGGGQNNSNNSLASSTSTQGEGAASGGGGGGGMEGVEFSFHFPGRMRPSGGAAAGSISSGPLAVVPDANRGIPSVPSIPGVFRKSVGGGFGSVRVVRSDAV